MVTGLPFDWAEATLRSLPLPLIIVIALSKSRFRTDSLSSLVGLLFPIGILYFLYDPGASGGAELWFYLLALAYFSFSLSVNRKRSWLAFSLIGLASLSTFVSLIHEGMIFFLPLMVLLAASRKDEKLGQAPFLGATLSLVTPFFISGLAAMLAPRVSVAQFCDLAISRLGAGSCEPLVYFHQMSLLDALELTISTLNSRTSALFLLWLGIALLHSTMLWRSSAPISRRLTTSSLWIPTLIAFSTVPIFLIGTDWGRWLSIISSLFFLRHLFSNSVSQPKWYSRLQYLFPFLPVISGTGTGAAGLTFWLEFLGQYL